MSATFPVTVQRVTVPGDANGPVSKSAFPSGSVLGVGVGVAVGVGVGVGVAVGVGEAVGLLAGYTETVSTIVSAPLLPVPTSVNFRFVVVLLAVKLNW